MNINEIEVSEFSDILYELDLAHTSCKENSCFDEYDSIAYFILEEYHQTKDFKQSVLNIFCDFFMLEEEDINYDLILNHINI